MPLIPKVTLGELERQIMEVVWSHERVRVREVLTQLLFKRKIAYTTVMTVMARLYRKGVLKRKITKSGAYIYRATQKREQFFASMSKKAINHILKQYGEIAIAQFVAVINESDSEKLRQWRSALKNVK